MPARLRVTEHRAEVVRCASCGRRAKAEFPVGVTAAVQYGPSVMARALYLHDYQLLPYARTAKAMKELFGCALSAGTLSTAVGRCAAGLVETELKIKFEAAAAAARKKRKGQRKTRDLLLAPGVRSPLFAILMVRLRRKQLPLWLTLTSDPRSPPGLT
jgi:hypothetical protein